MNDVKKALKNFNLTSKVTLGLVLGIVLLILDSFGFYSGQPMPELVFKIGQAIALLIVALGLSDVANLEKKNIIQRIKDMLVSAPVLGTVIELVNLTLNALPNFSGVLPAGIYNGLHALAAALIALGLRQQIGSARLNNKPVSSDLLEKAKYQIFKQ